jgi:hypothetical protein
MRVAEKEIVVSCNVLNVAYSQNVMRKLAEIK